MGFESELCIYCQKRTSTRKGDHVPPQCFFRNARGFKLIQVPCCTICNVEFSKDDEFVRDLLSSEERNEQHDTVKLHVAEKRKRAWERTPSRLQKMLDASKVVDVGAPLGRPDKRLAMNWDRPELDRFLKRMGRAIFYDEYKLLIKDQDCHWDLTENFRPEGQDQLRSILANGRPHVFGDEEFQYRAVHVVGSSEGIALLRFYRGTEFVVTLYKPERLEKFQ
jgi:hypothetical protein